MFSDQLWKSWFYPDDDIRSRTVSMDRENIDEGRMDGDYVPHMSIMDFGQLPKHNNNPLIQYSIKGRNTQMSSSQTTYKFPSFTEIYTSCFTNGTSLADSASVHMTRAITTLNPQASKYRKMIIKLVIENKGYTNGVSETLHRHYPYGFFSHDVFIGFKEPTIETSIPDMVMRKVESFQSISKFEISYLPTHEFSVFLNDLENHLFRPPVSVEIIKSINAQGEPYISTVEFKPTEMFVPHVAFYPFFSSEYPKQNMDELSIPWIVDDFMNSKSNLLLLVGPPGTGKSTFIRSFFRDNHENRMVNNGTVLEHPALPNTFRDKSEKDDNKLLTVYEDADIFVAPREKGNLGLSAMLNQLDGAVGSKEKFIISTNLESLSKIDKALLRPGRCHKVLQFRKLVGGEINAARESVDKDPIDVNAPLTLSEALHFEEVNIDDRKAVFGFLPSVN